MTMTHRERMLAAYGIRHSRYRPRGGNLNRPGYMSTSDADLQQSGCTAELCDYVPVSPELWYDVSLRYDDSCTWQDVCTGAYPLWRAQLAAHRYFDTAAWLIAAADVERGDDVTIRSTQEMVGDAEMLVRYEGRSAAGTLTWTLRHTDMYYDWVVEHPIKRVPEDLAAFEQLFFPGGGAVDTTGVDEAVCAADPQGVVTVYCGDLFFSTVATYMEGGPGETIMAFLDHEATFAAMQERYIDAVMRLADRVARNSNAQILLLHNGYSTAGIINPQMYERWDVPVIRAAADAVHRHGKLLHLHQHGRCVDLLNMIAGTGVDLVEPFERGPSGDCDDLGAVKRQYGEKFAIRGNVHAHDVLLRGSVDDVRRQCRECVESAAQGGGFILASGDGVIAGTPEENIFAMVEAGKEYGRYGDDMSLYRQDMKS